MNYKKSENSNEVQVNFTFLFNILTNIKILINSKFNLIFIIII